MKYETPSEHFINKHVFIYILKGENFCYDGSRMRFFKAGEYYLLRRNSMVRGDIEKGISEFEMVIIRFSQEFLKAFQEKYKTKAMKFNSADTFIKINKTELIPNFIHSLNLYYDSSGKIGESFVNVKHEELLIILLQNQPELAGIFFDYGIPAKLNLEEFMNRNFKFNTSIEDFAYLTGRSLSAFKRDFKTIFKTTPNRWLIHKRLQEAYFLIEQEHKKPSEIYLDMGFESFSHFSFAFKKLFGITPTELTDEKKEINHKKKVLNY